MTVYDLMYDDNGIDIVTKFYVSIDEYAISATRLSPDSAVGMRLPNCNIGDIIDINGFEYLVEKIDHVKIDLKSLY